MTPSWQIVPGLTLKGNIATDYTGEKIELKEHMETASVFGGTSGYYGLTNRAYQTIYGDALINFNKTFGKFGVDGIAELDTKVDLYKALSEEVKKLESDYRNYLARIEKTWETLEEQHRIISDELKKADNMSVDAVKVRIAELCGSADIESFCRVNEKTIRDYVDDDIEDRLNETTKTVETLTSKVEADGQIPEEYMGITDSQQYTEDMKLQIDSLTAELETLASDINAVNDQIKALNESLRSNGDYDFSHFDDDYYEEIRRLNGELEEAKREGKIWHELRVVFDAVKAGRPAVPHDGFDADFLKVAAPLLSNTNDRLLIGTLIVPVPYK